MIEDDFIEYIFEPGQSITLSTITSSESEYHNSPSISCDEAAMSKIERLKGTNNFKVRISLTRWICLPKQEAKRKLFGEYFFTIRTHKGMFFNNWPSESNIYIIAELYHQMILDMIDYWRTFQGIEKIPDPIPDDTLRLVRHLIKSNRQYLE